MNAAATQILVGIVIAAVSSLITVHLSLGRFRREKWWERKVTAYERIIEALHACKADAEAWLAADENRELAKEQRDEIQQRARAAHMELAKAVDVGDFILSDAAHARLVQYRNQSREAENNEDLHAYVEADLAATDRCIVDLILIAKKDLHTLTMWRRVIHTLRSAVRK